MKSQAHVAHSTFDQKGRPLADRFVHPLCGLAFALLPALACSAAHSIPPHSSPGDARDVLWSDPYDRRAYFIPEAMLRHPDWQALPLSDNGKQSLRYRVFGDPHAVPSPRGGIARDVEWQTGLGTPRPDAPTFRDFVRASRVVVVGIVERVVRGWQPGRFKPTAMVWIRVRAVLRAFEGQPRRGDRLAYDQGYAAITIAGRRLAFLPPEAGNAVEARAGDRVLVTGGLCLDSRLLGASVAWPVSSSGSIRALGFDFVQSVGVESLDSLRKFLAQSEN